MKKLLLILSMTLLTNTYALEICQTKGSVSKKSIVLSALGQHAIIASEFCSLMANGEEFCRAQEASYAVTHISSTRAESHYSLKKEDGSGEENLTLITSLEFFPSPSCHPRACYPRCKNNCEYNTKKKYTLAKDNGSVIFICLK